MRQNTDLELWKFTERYSFSLVECVQWNTHFHDYPHIQMEQYLEPEVVSMHSAYISVYVSDGV